mgnify:CR=1 FL=1
MVIWIIGLSGSGKTTFANELCKSLNNGEEKYIKIDGDIIRDLFQNDLGHSYQDRRKNANRIMKLSHFLNKNGINVICSILSISREDRIWNRKNIPNYFEIFIDVKMDILKKRDSKNLYKNYDKGLIKDVVGCDIIFEEPVDCDYRIENNNDLKYLFSHIEILKSII